MPIMKKLLNSLILMLLLGGVVACRSDLNSDLDGNHRSQRIKNEPIKKTIHMSFGGDFITQSEEPLLRAEDGDKYTAVNVWRTDNNKPNALEEKYAFGLFKNKDALELEVVTGFKYRFEAAILVEKEDKIEKLVGYNSPFRLYDNKVVDFDNAWEFEYDLDDFVYSSYDANGDPNDDAYREYFCELNKGYAYVNYGKASDHNQGVYKYPRIKRYYGKLQTFDPEINDAADIPMSYKSFGLKIVVEELPAGYITFEDITGNTTEEKDLLTFPIGKTLSKSEEWEDLYSMNNLSASSETFKLRFTWHKGGDVTESFTTDVVVQPKKIKVLKVKITGTPNYETKGNVTFSMESDELEIVEEEVSHDFN